MNPHALNTLAAHPAAEIFPLLEGADLQSLADDIKAHGLISPIVLHNGMVLDGRNRLTACLMVGVEPRFEEWPNINGDPVLWVLSTNLHRRHLTTSQRAMVAEKVAKLRSGVREDRQGSGNPLPTSESTSQRAMKAVSQANAAKALNVSTDSVKQARVVAEHGVPELTRAVERGKIAVSTAADIAGEPEEEQRKIDLSDERAVLAKAKEIRARKTEVRRQERVEKIAKISRGNSPLPTDAPETFPVIYADPPWRYEHAESESRAIENQYPTMELDAICSLPVAKLATPDAILFLWATSPKLEEAMRVMREWGFTYRTCAVWDKGKIGMGYYFRQQHELLLVGTRGEMPVPAPNARPSSVICWERGEHSAKPPEFYGIIERMYPTLHKLEMFCRSPREGWHVWGNQAQLSLVFNKAS